MEPSWEKGAWRGPQNRLEAGVRWGAAMEEEGAPIEGDTPDDTALAPPPTIDTVRNALSAPHLSLRHSAPGFSCFPSVVT